MMKTLTGLFITLGFLVPAFASASVTITSATLNGGSSVQVQPGANIEVAVKATLTDSSKWKGINWGINSGAITTTCVNTKNAKEGTRNNDTGVFTETFIIKAPGQPGLYNATFLADIANNCGKPTGSAFTLSQAVRVGINTVKPVISAHSDISVQLASGATSAVVEYIKPFATDPYGNLVTVSCAPASGQSFPVGNTTVSCTATDSWGNVAIPSTFVVSILPFVVAPPSDTEAPVIAAHSNLVVEATSAAGAVVTYVTPEVTDNSAAAITASCTPVSGSTFALGMTSVNCTAQDGAGNSATPTTFTVEVRDTTAPILAAHDTVYASTTGTSTMVNYAAPTATDGVDTSVEVSCVPASGSVFAVGTTTVTCTANDDEGNTTSSSFNVIVKAVGPELYTMNSQPDESYQCGDVGTWRYCDEAGTFSLTDVVGQGVKTIDLGLGSAMGEGTIQSVTIAKDPAFGEDNLFHPWLITIRCFDDSSHNASCSEWSSISRTASTNPSADGVHWVANFSTLNRTFAQDKHYVMTIDDTGWDNPAYGSEDLEEPYWLIRGLR